MKCYLLLAALLSLALPLRAQEDPVAEGSRVAAEMRAHRTSADTLLLDSITAPAATLRDGQVFQAAIEIGGDRTASAEARVFAIRTLIWALVPALPLDYSDLALQICPSRISADFLLRRGSALPADYESRIRELANRLVSDSTEALPPRYAALCVKGTPTLPERDGWYIATERYVVAGEDYQLVYVCGNTFYVRSFFDVPIEITYRVEGSTETGTLFLPARSPGTAYSQTTLTTEHSGTAQLLLDDYVVEAAANGGTPCS